LSVDCEPKSRSESPSAVFFESDLIDGLRPSNVEVGNPGQRQQRLLSLESLVDRDPAPEPTRRSRLAVPRTTARSHAAKRTTNSSRGDEQGPKLGRGFSVATQALPQNAMARFGSFAARPADSTGVNLTTRHSQPVEGGDVCGAKRDILQKSCQLAPR